MASYEAYIVLTNEYGRQLAYRPSQMTRSIAVYHSMDPWAVPSPRRQQSSFLIAHIKLIKVLLR